MRPRAFVVASLLAAGTLGFVAAGCGSKGTVAPLPQTVEGSVPRPTTTATTTTTPVPAGDAVAGKAVFESAGCKSCHTLKAAGATGTVGPNLDQVKPDAARVIDRVTNGKGIMPSFKGQLSPKQIADVAAFVSRNAGS